MAKVKEKNVPEATSQAPETVGFSDAPMIPTAKRKKKNRRKLIRRIISLVVVLALIAGIVVWRKNSANQEGSTEVLTDMVTRGSITSMVEGSGAAVPKNSASITLLSDGQVLEVFVSEGDYVQKGDQLYSIESSAAQTEYNKAEKDLRSAQKEYDKIVGAANDLNVRADYTGILTDVATIAKGDLVTAGSKVATLVDNTKLLLPLYFSYAYENTISVGQSATVSIPATMAQLPGTVQEIHKVQYVSPEGGRFFEAVIAVDNPGTLAEKMTATATLSIDGETVYPYAPGEMKWFRTQALIAEISGECAANKLYDYMPVRAGESVLTLTAESSEDALESAEATLDAAKDRLDKAQKNLDALNGVAPIDGTVLSLGITAGEEVKTGTLAVSIADTTTMIVNTQIDEMNVSFAKAGMPVNITLWENQMFGTIDSVSLTASASDGMSSGVARFPMVISVDNSEGLLMSGAYVNYSFTASQSDDCLVVPIQCVKSAQTVDGAKCKVLFVQTDEPPVNDVELAVDMMEIPEGFYPAVVEIGISDNNSVEIKSGVEEGTIVYAGVMQNDGDMGMGLYF
ncbi:MAG: HlyD family efflux transporter periplasmic adaptor subunit [Oscillospiraceae bacterium]|nr:HlyD family efflux transporter periplasmic adaptor subunit [Oscillospiraceae bacterium]